MIHFEGHSSVIMNAVLPTEGTGLCGHGGAGNGGLRNGLDPLIQQKNDSWCFLCFTFQIRITSKRLRLGPLSIERLLRVKGGRRATPGAGLCGE